MSFRLATIATAHGPRAAIIVGDRVLDVAAATGRMEDRSTMDLLADWEANLPRLDALVRDVATKGQPLASAMLLPPVTRPGAIYCAGANYADHAGR